MVIIVVFGFYFAVADKVFGPHTASHEVYEVAAKPVVKAAMEGVNGIEFPFCRLLEACSRFFYILECKADNEDLNNLID